MIKELQDTPGSCQHDNFQLWRGANPDGIFLTLETKTKANLHGSQCVHLGNTTWNADYKTGRNSLTRKRKILGSGTGALAIWAVEHGVEVRICQHCLRDGYVNEEEFRTHRPAKNNTALKHFVSYHNAEKMGYTYEEATPFTVATSRPVRQLPGSRVWSISGEGKPRNYLLRETWIVDEIGTLEQEEFVNYAQGSAGYTFEPPIHLNRLRWFPAFLKSQSNFSLGLQPIKEEFIAKLNVLWSNQSGESGRTLYPDEVDSGAVYHEGAVIRVCVNAYERSLAARRACIKHYGTSCFICKFSFGQVYGPSVDGLIHVHHLRPLSEVAAEYTIDPVADLRPVCPNCHAVLHSRNPAYSVEEIREFMKLVSDG